ncbi:hypothetical protein ACP70R_033233 [Stipagrostis hirtigluma subsp. patula]
MEDAAGQPIHQHDLVKFKTTGAQHGGRGVVLRAKPGRMLCVRCIDGAEVTMKACDVTVIDRTYFEGMAVAPASDHGGQIGIVTGFATALDLVQIDGEAPVVIARDVSPVEVQRVTELSVGDYVVSGQWLGRVAELSLDVDVLFDDGGLCRVTRAEGRLRTLDKNSGGCNFYPGQRVASSCSVFKASRWLNGYWKPTAVEGTVAKVEMSGVVVYWVASSQLGTDRHLVRASAPPAYQQNPHALTLFSSFRDIFCFWGVGDRCLFRHHAPTTSTTEDHKSPSVAGRRLPSTCWNRRLRMGVKRRTDRRHAEFQRPMSIADTRTTVDVLWQDGTRRRGMPSMSLVPFLWCTQHDFFPGERVVRRTPLSSIAAAAADGNGLVVATDDDVPGLAARSGVVRSHNYKDQTVQVSWLKASATRPGEEPGGEIECDETVSTYDVASDFDHFFFYGDVVVRLRQTKTASNGDRGGSIEEPKPTRINKNKVVGADDLSWVGRVVDLCDGYVQVKWGDGNTSKVLPDEIARINELVFVDMHQEMDDWVYDGGDNDNTVDKAQEDASRGPAAAADNNDNGEGDDDSSSASDGEDGRAAATTTASWAGTVIQAVIRLAGEVLSRGKGYLVSGADAENVETAMPLDGAALTSTNGGGTDGDGSARKEGETEADATVGDNNSFQFSQFDVVQSPPDHQYLDVIGQGTGGGRNWTKRVQKEWKMLQDNLPDTIFVRAFEDRMDLLRVVMVGASGTPYHDGLFFFDLQLPPSYPAVPPLVNYRSFGLRVNPNLYPSGTVCLSLLDTFDGEGAELWSPESSSVLQVVVSIQGLVLNAQPYYNEAGYADQAGTPEGRRNELPYSENAYLLTLRTMLHVLRRPPVGFEEFVRDHFRRRGRHVIRACEAYLEGCLVGTLDGEGGGKEQECSVGFRLALANVVPRLVQAFNDSTSLTRI